MALALNVPLSESMSLEIVFATENMVVKVLGEEEVRLWRYVKSYWLCAIEGVEANVESDSGA